LDTGKKWILLSSRIETTRNLVATLPDSAKHITFFSTSAVGFYGFHEDEELIESSPSGEDFLAKLAHDWEQEALRAQDKVARVIITRFGIVRGKNGGALGQMIPLFKYF
jgi:NAD dependent epimerase/dehydratase family enzyme